MPVNRNALIRYRTIDKCLQNRFRKWTLEDLIEACSAALYEYEGIQKGISKRSVQLDIQFMRSDKLGYNAPIVVIDKKFYAYEDPDYSITKSPLAPQDLDTLEEVIKILEQFKGFSHFADVTGMLKKMEDKVYRERNHSPSIIHFETNTELKGLEYLDTLYQAILKTEVLKITYKGFKAKGESEFEFHPHLLKEFRNRWFLLGRKGKYLTTLALDRIIAIDRLPEKRFLSIPQFDATTYFDDIIGVTKNEGSQSEEVLLWVSKAHAPYVETKPLHPSQEIHEIREDGTVFKLKIRHNYELERDILGFGETMKVLEPEFLRNRIHKRAAKLRQLYTESES